MSDDDDRDYRRTGFGKDSREFFTKLVVGFLLGVFLWGAVYVWKGADMTFWGGQLLGHPLVFWFARSISGSSRHAD